MRPFMTLAATGIATLLVLKVLAAVAVPVAGALIGFVVLAVKFTLIAIAAFLVFMLFRRLTRSEF